MKPTLPKAYRFLAEEVWNLDESTLKRHEAYLVKAWKLIYLTARQFTNFQLALRAMSLVFTTLLSIVPLLAVSFSVLAAFGVHNQVAPMLNKFLAPLGPQGGEITQRIEQYIGRMKVGVLGVIGLVASLLYGHRGHIQDRRGAELHLEGKEAKELIQEVQRVPEHTARGAYTDVLGDRPDRLP